MKQQQQQRWQASLTFFASGTQANLTWFGGWVWSGFAKHWTLLGMLGLTALGCGVGLFNWLPQVIGCPSTKTLCYVLTWDKESVVLPSPLKRHTSNQKR